MKKEDLKKYIEKIMHTKPIFIILIIGVVLILLPTGTKTEKTSEKTESTESYRAQIQKDLKHILSMVKGAGAVDVLVTLSDGGEVFYAKDGQAEENSEKHERQSADTYVLKEDAGGGESPLVLKSETPEVSGVLVVATGAKDPQVKERIISAVRAVTGVKAHRVEVLEKK